MHEVCIIREASSHLLEMFEVNDSQSEESAVELVRALNRGEVQIYDLVRQELVHRNPATAYYPRGAFFPVGSRF